MSYDQYNWRYPISFQGGFRKWDWHASVVEPDGRILMPMMLLRPADGHVADANGLVDITALAGTKVMMVRYGVLRLLHVHWSAWPTFERFHQIETTEEDGRIYYHFDPAMRMSSIYNKWEKELEEPSSMEDFAIAKSFFKFANPPSDRLPPRAVIRAAARTLTHNPTCGADLRQFMVVRTIQTKAIIEAVRAERADIAHGKPSPATHVVVSEEEMKARVPFLAGLANSCFETAEEDAERFVGPDATSRARLSRITVGFVPAAFFTYSKAPVTRHPVMIPRYLRSLSSFTNEAIAENPALNLAVTADIDRAFEHVAFGDLLVIRGSRGWRDRMVQDAASFLRHARKTMLAFDPDGSKGILDQAPAEQSDREEFLRRVKEEYADDRETYGASRTKFANRVKNAYDRVIDAAAHRILQIKVDGTEGRGAIDFLLSDAGCALPYWDTFVEGPELSETGQPTGRQQIRRYRWWRIDDAWASLLNDRHWSMEPAPDVWRASQATAGGALFPLRHPPTEAHRLRRPPFLGSQFACEFLSATNVDQPDSSSTMPLLAMLARHHALVDGGWLDVGQLEMKEDLRRRWRIPRNPSASSGLLQFDSERARLARQASRSERRHPRVFVPHEEAEHALRFAAHGVDATTQTWCRPSEFLQQDQFGDHWEDPAGSDAFGWIASRKLNRRDPVGLVHFLECDENHYLESVALLDLTCRRCRIEEPAIVAPWPELAWKLEPGPYVFAFDGKVVRPRALRLYLNFLLVNVSDARFHDLRAGASNRSRRKGATQSVLGAGLGHRSAGFIELYSSLTPEQLEEDADEVRIAKIDRIEAEKNRRNLK
ncbi:hypothetical protein HMP09_1971 [Sphingomonas sp. HMP9]|uniref:hypothetical protein n=1 Tax=Sphingomonas sp. HMP9 TaxID=1517554 RepID=UPI001596952E|nr:hypothetical protein [Sphingomonas sp. HMP9]BCA62737.1 hypothetical protein HMP09_1971 [Sphingomonas sp. HMP9]